MNTNGTFPFGQPVLKLTQQDRTPKKAFVLGVYASAVHARWIGPDGRDVVKALAVASEPCIFWDGKPSEAKAIISQIPVPKELGNLVPARDDFNGPSGRTLISHFLHPKGFDRNDTWLCDLVPHSCVNPQQQKAIDRAYTQLATEHGLPVPSVPAVPDELTDSSRRADILAELRLSQARQLILLGDLPIKWFLRHFDNRWSKLSDFHTYGQRHKVSLDGYEVEVLPLCHPRQAAKLGMSSAKWYQLHQDWMKPPM